MAKIYTLKINNFQGIDKFEQKFNSNFVCIIGRGDSGKTTILKAISNVLHPNWNLTFYDTDFYNCDIDNDINIEVTLFDVPERLLHDSKFGRYIRGIDSNGNIQDEINDELTPCLTIKLIVNKDLEPKWYVVSNRQDDIEIRAGDRSLFNVFLVSDYIEKHFSWNKGNPLYSLLREEGEEIESESVILESIREAKSKIDDENFSQFDTVLEKIKNSAGELGLDISDVSTTIDFRDISIKNSKVSLHHDKIPFRQKGKGTKRLLSMAIQHELIKKGGIILIDEIEQGLEPDRVQHLVSQLKKDNKGQIFITTHSRDVLVELEHNDLYLKRLNNIQLDIFNPDLKYLIRSRPEALFSKKIIVCEGETEIGLCRALNDYNIKEGFNNMSYLGVKLILGKGSSSIKVCNDFIDLGYKVCLFCDSDVEEINTQKKELENKGVTVIDWKNDNALETAIFKNIPFLLAQKLIDLAISIKVKETGEDLVKIKQDICGYLKSKLGEEINLPLKKENYTEKVKIALGKIAESNSAWFKQIGKGIKLGEAIFNDYDSLESSNEIKENFKKLSNWIQND